MKVLEGGEDDVVHGEREEKWGRGVEEEEKGELGE